MGFGQSIVHDGTTTGVRSGLEKQHVHNVFGVCCRQSFHSEEAVSADDLLSTTIAAIVVAQPQHLVSCLEYLKLFHGTGDWSGKTGFQVATLEAAAAYLEQINPSCSPLSAAGTYIILLAHFCSIWC